MGLDLILVGHMKVELSMQSVKSEVRLLLLHLWKDHVTLNVTVKIRVIYMLETLSSRPLKHDDQGKSEPPGRPAVKSGVWLSCGISGIGGFGL